MTTRLIARATATVARIGPTRKAWPFLCMLAALLCLFAPSPARARDRRDKLLRLMRADKDRYMKDADAVSRPVYDAAWHWDEGTKQLRLRVRQTQKGAVFRMPLDLELKTGDTARRETVEVSEREQAFAFKLEHRP